MGCVVTGWSAAVGTHTVTATATDLAGNASTSTRTYTVDPWTILGFYQPVDMNMLNIVKGGSTVPLKFEVFAGSTELINVSAIKSFTVQQIGCDFTGPVDDIELYSTGGTSLRYDSTSGQFIQNWQTPKGAGKCYTVKMTTQDDTFIYAMFKTK